MPIEHDTAPRPPAPVLLAGTPPPPRDYDADVIILSHHRLAETIAAIHSAAAQTGCDHHVIVLDQASPAAMRSALAETIDRFDRVALYGIDVNLGVPGGRNEATALGHGSTIVALDNDAVFADPHVVATASARFAADPALGAIGFRILAADGQTLDETSWAYPKSLRPRAAARFAATTFVGCGHALSRRCFDTLGGYDSSLFFTWEEYEFARRAIDGGWRIEHHGDLTVIHAVAAEARVAWSGARWRYFVRNRVLIALDWNDRSEALLRSLAYLAKGLAAGRGGATVASLAEALRIARTRPRRRPGPGLRAALWHDETRHRLRRAGSPSARPG